jgi:ribosomal protein S18 acetylase RimI-like enzyme
MEYKEWTNSVEEVRARGHQLAAPGFNEPEKLVAWMGAVQAQDYGMSKWALGVRLKSATIREVNTALHQGKILRTHVMRPTWHLVAAGDIRWMLQLSKERIKASSASRDRALEITEPLYSKCNRLVEKILEGHHHLTRQELASELAKAGIAVDTSRMIHFMMRAEVEGIVCSGIDKGNKQTYALIDERIPPAKALHKEEALATLATRYFRSHSPAGLQDFVWWSGLSVSEAKQAVHLIQPELFTVRFRETPLLVHQSCSEAPEPLDTLHLLPAFDEYIIAYKDRTSILETEHHAKAFSKNGIFHPIIVANGRIVGTWQKAVHKNRVTVKPAFFDAINPGGDRVKSAEERYNAFLTGDILTVRHRFFREDDFPLLEDLLYEAIFQPEGAQPLPRDIIKKPEIDSAIREFGKKQGDFCILAELNGKTVGGAWSRLSDDETKSYGHIDPETPELVIAVFKEYRNLGIGRGLMRNLIDSTLTHGPNGYKQISLSVDKKNYAVKMYKELGFEIVKENEQDYVMVLKRE